MTMTAPEPPKPATPAWEITPIGQGAWRISDSSIKHNDSGHLVAYVDRNETGTLEVLWLRSPCPTKSRYHDLEEVLRGLDAAVAAAGVVGPASRPWRIPHFPPV